MTKEEFCNKIIFESAIDKEQDTKIYRASIVFSCMRIVTNELIKKQPEVLADVQESMERQLLYTVYEDKRFALYDIILELRRSFYDQEEFLRLINKLQLIAQTL